VRVERGQLRWIEHRRPPAGPLAPEVERTVREIVEGVSEGGDEAVLEYTRRFDTGGQQPWPLRVEALQLREALEGLAPPLRQALELAAANVRAVALAALDADRRVDLPQGHTVTLREVPVQRAALYVPGGRAPYPSTVVMGAVTAQVAGVEEVVVCSPPGAGGDVHQAVLAACALCGVEEVYRMGGAQAVAALARGTGTIEHVDVIAGPGNVYVQEAKRQLSAVVGIDSYAGPSELVVVFDASADPRLVVSDLLAQAEHGEGSRVVAVSPAEPALDAVQRHLEAAPDTGARCELLDVPDLEAGLGFAEELAPEHLQLMGDEAEALAAQVRSAGCLFVGASTGTAFGDYVAGSNHVLPTGGAARFASALSVRTFRRTMAEVRLDGAAAELAPPGALIARAEGFEAHARSMQERIRDNGGDG
jgi:histidinol dehydrogenase